ncbi:MAG: hypothetical protein MR277_08985 [Methanobrevibacter ruminantium]|uniref:hypothetical protein n=1 Tax=Methanobrevibacter ruminantium TaxID=83816 RepID=UPI002D7E50CD|nr:hypothetical protein [Methanobrevibacter ruminantium]MCI5738124.1 hypothetical protein [Methanobrevibacter ruminantium]
MEDNLHTDPETSILATSNIFLPIFKDIFVKEGISEEKKELVFYSSQEKVKESLDLYSDKFYQKEYDPNQFWVNVLLLEEFRLYPEVTIEKINEIRKLRNILEHNPELRKRYTDFDLERYALEYSDFIYDFILEYYKKYILHLDNEMEPKKDNDCILINKKLFNISSNENVINMLVDESSCDNFYYCEYKEYVTRLISNMNKFNGFKEEFDLKDINTPNDLDKSIEYLKIFEDKPKYVNNEKHLFSAINEIRTFQNNIPIGNMDDVFYEFKLIRKEFINVKEDKTYDFILNRFKEKIEELRASLNKISFFYKCKNIYNFKSIDKLIKNLELLELKPIYMEDPEEIELLLEIVKDKQDDNPIYDQDIIEARENVEHFNKKINDCLIKRDILKDVDLDNQIEKYEESKSFIDSPLANRLEEVPDIREKLEFIKNKLNKFLYNSKYKGYINIFEDIYGKNFAIDDIEFSLNRLEICKRETTSFQNVLRKHAKYDVDSVILVKEAKTLNNLKNAYAYHSQILDNLERSKIKLAKYDNWEENSKKLEYTFGDLYTGFESDLVLINKQFIINKKYSDLVNKGFYKENIAEYINDLRLKEDISQLKYIKDEMDYLVKDVNKTFYTKDTLFSRDNIYSANFDDILKFIFEAHNVHGLIVDLDLEKNPVLNKEEYSDFYHSKLMSNLKKFIVEIDKFLNLLELKHINLYIKHVNSTKKNLEEIKGFFINYMDSTRIKEKIDDDVISRTFFGDRWNGTQSNINDLLRYLERSKSFTSLIDADVFSKNMEKTIQNYSVESLMNKLNNLGRLKKVFNEDTFLEFLLNTSFEEISETDFNTIKDALEDFNTCCLKINE